MNCRLAHLRSTRQFPCLLPRPSGNVPSLQKQGRNTRQHSANSQHKSTAHILVVVRMFFVDYSCTRLWNMETFTCWKWFHRFFLIHIRLWNVDLQWQDWEDNNVIRNVMLPTAYGNNLETRFSNEAVQQKMRPDWGVWTASGSFSRRKHQWFGEVTIG